MVNGTSYSLVSYVEVEWPWLVLPVAIAFLSLLFLIGTMKQSSRTKAKPWKTSTLATLQVLSNELHDELGPLVEVETMEQATEKHFVQLEEQDGG